MKSHSVRLKDLWSSISLEAINHCLRFFLKLARSTREFSDHLRCAAKLNIAQNERLIDL